MIVSLTGIRRRIIDSFPASFKKTIAGGIGFYHRVSGPQECGDDCRQSAVDCLHGRFIFAHGLLGFAGILLAIIIVLRKVPGALVISILVLSMVGSVSARGGSAQQDYSTAACRCFPGPTPSVPCF